MSHAQDLAVLDEAAAILDQIDQCDVGIKLVDPPPAEALTDKERQIWRLKELPPRAEAVKPHLDDFGKLRACLVGLAHRYLEDPSDLLLEDHRRLWWCSVHGGHPQDDFAIGAPCCPWACGGWRKAARKELRDIRDAIHKESALLREAEPQGAAPRRKEPLNPKSDPTCFLICKVLANGPLLFGTIANRCATHPTASTCHHSRTTIKTRLRAMKNAGQVEQVGRGLWQLTPEGRKLLES